MQRTQVDAAQGLVFIVWAYEGVISLAATVFGFEPALSLPRRLDSPWSIVVAVAIIAVGLVVMRALDRLRRPAGA